MLNILFIVDETFTGKIKHIKENDEDSQVFEQKSDEQPNTTDMPDLESEESAAHRRNQPGERLKILTPSLVNA